MEWLVGGASALVVGALIAFGYKKHAEKTRRDAEERSRRDEILFREETEARAAPPLAQEPDGSGVNAVGRRINDLLREYDSLRTFQDVARWDALAEQAAADADAAGKQLSAWVADTETLIADYKARASEPRHIVLARVSKTTASTQHLNRIVQEFAKAYDALVERIEMTPNNKKDQSALLRELRAEKKELQLRKKDVRASAAEVRREARQLSASAGTSNVLPWPTYNARAAAHERRAIRRAKEAALGPHEDAISALDRQINDVDRRIAWLQRFGDADDA